MRRNCWSHVWPLRPASSRTEDRPIRRKQATTVKARICNGELCFRSPFRLDLELSFCMRSLKSINFAEKIVPAKTNCQNITNFENHTPKIFKMSIFMKIKTSPALTPYYSTEPKKLCSTSHFCYISMPWTFQGPQNIIKN